MPKPLVDVHVHFGAPDDPSRPDWFHWSEEFKRSVAHAAFRLVTWTWPTKLDYMKAKRHIIKLAGRSDEVGPCILLALDKVYDSAGTPHLDDWTHLYVANEAIAEIVQERPDLFLYGASVHPFRSDWEAELERCKAGGAVLCKWIPSSQQIDPTHPRCGDFYAKLAALGLPLLCHAGPENAIPTSDHAFDEFNNPKYLRKALEMGVTVIVPHCALPFPPQDLATFEPYQELLKLVADADANGWPLYVDLSALLLFRDDYIKTLLSDFQGERSKRLLFGSDYPIPMSDLAYKQKLSFWDWLRRFWRSLTETNLLDKNYYLIRDMGFDPRVFTNANDLFLH